MKLYKFLKASASAPDKKVGDTIELDESDAITKAYVEAGILEEQADAGEAIARKVAETLKALTTPDVDSLATKIAENLAKSTTGPKAAGIPAEAKEARSMGDWFQCLAFTAQTGDPELARLAAQKLEKKYGTRPSHDFATNWAKGQGLNGDLAMSGQTVHKASTLIETTGSLGGATLPIEFYPELIKLVGERSVLFPRVRIYPMSALEMQVPALDYSLGGSGKSPYLAGMSAQWGAEGAAFVQQNPNFRQITLRNNLLTGFTQASRTLLADNRAGLEAVLPELFADTIAFYVDYAILNGTGANQPLGILNSAAAIAVNRQSAGNGAILTDHANMLGHFLPRQGGAPMWLNSPSVKATLVTMNDASGRVVFLPNFPATTGGPATVNVPMAVLGYLAETSQLPASSGTAGDVFLLDLSAYAFGLRQEIEIGVSEHVGFLSNLMTWRFILRGDGQPKINTYLTLQNGDTVSPFVYRN